MNPQPTAKEIAQLWFEQVWNQRDAAKARELMAADAVGYLEGGREIVGPESFLEFQGEFLRAMPDIHIDVVDALADGTRVCVHWNAKGTHTGPGLGMVPSGAAVAFRGVTWFDTKDGQIIDGRDFWNMDGLIQKLAAAGGTAG